MALSRHEVASALATLALWRGNPDAEAACPKCGAVGLSIVDRSARPHAEWYHLECKGCGLEETIHIPLGPPVMGGLD